MILDVSRALKVPGQSYPFDGALALAPMDVLDDVVSFDAVSVTGSFTGSGESVTVAAQASATARARCAKCLAPVSMPLEASVDATFARTPNPDDPDQYPLDGYAIDLRDPVKDALLLELPMRFLCGEDCQGLCPSCGANLNDQRCTCQEGGKRTNPFSALSELLTEDEEV